MRTDELDYHLPPECIATRPAEPRDSARMLVVRRDERRIEHRVVRDLPEVLAPGDTLVFNTTAVMPARLVARRATGGMVEGLALGPARALRGASSDGEPWRVLLRGSARLRAGETLTLLNAHDVVTGDRLVLDARDGEAWIVRFEPSESGDPPRLAAGPSPDPRAVPRADPTASSTSRSTRTPDGNGSAPTLSSMSSMSSMSSVSNMSSMSSMSILPTMPPERIIDRNGRTPLPPYILHARRERHDLPAHGDDDDRAWYETVYADARRRGSIAAPTAGLHFTAELLDRLRQRGIGRIDVLLHVGAGTFKPIDAETLEAHTMHREWYEVSAEALEAIRAARSAGHERAHAPPDARAAGMASTGARDGSPGRIVAVGTTTCRTLESLPSPLPDPAAGAVAGETGILIAPGHRFRHVDALMTNFHLPRSTLLALVAALVGLEWLKEIYAEAIRSGYRFYSYGDAMLVL